ncbi:uncharacterized protein NECHADRAFT_101017 [Fusarium vanettenii 77-13-4]|jgi:hypothetical protein|uniref:Uncharacterized protein n=1 Tax=Fusarium vanettenii (strain ATCC MYA-4622 / CBS 123669 / FGSC 9596 / NRRL 45880 / 77-13-4) TaxID=660122 RepID=C7ZA53_FUSV7|nr:uncharacterized protein NECHADRAFT_101017 [Fusarium vanettenii 77-13-4]EEU39616.1 predicted protein [Fusarium vanettenii 77-13-4]
MPPKTAFFAPKGPRRYMSTRPKQAYLVARVKGVGGQGSFLEKDETIADTIPELYDNEQPPFFQPREEWDHWDPATFEYPCTTDDRQLINRKLGKTELQRSYFENPTFDISWADHVESLWCLHQDLACDDKMLLNISIGGVLRMLANGLEKVVTVTRCEIEIPGKESKCNSHWNTPTPYLPDHYDRIKAYFDMGFYGPRRWRESLIGKRFFAGFVRHRYNSHFTTFIWDRKKADLYHFDTLPDDQMIRAKNVSLAWREHLAVAGQPYDFNFHAIPLTPQRGAWECGLLSSFCLFQTLRGLVGLSADALAQLCPPTTLEIDGEENEPVGSFDLLVRDWMLDSWTRVGKSKDIAYDDNVEVIKGIFQTMIIDEIGIQDGYYLHRTGRGPFAKHQSTYADEVKYKPSFPDELRATEWLYTDMGGYMPAEPESIGTVSNWTIDRLIPAPTINPGDKALLPRGPGPLSAIVMAPVLADMPDDLIRWYKRQDFEIKDNVPIFEGGELISSDSSSSSEVPDPGSKAAVKKPVNPVSNRKKQLIKLPRFPPSTASTATGKPVTPAPPEKTKDPWTPSGPLKSLSLGTPKRPRPSSKSSSEYVQSSSSSSSGGKESKPGAQGGDEPVDQTMTGYGWGECKDGRPYVADIVPDIRGAEQFTCSTLESDDECTPAKRTVGPATKIMSTFPGLKGWLGEVGSRPTQRLLTGNYATYVPAGLVRPSQWDDIIRAAAQPWAPATASKESRDERMKKRQRSRGE